MRYHSVPITVAKIQNTNTTKCWQWCAVTGIVTYYHFGRHFGSFYIDKHGLICNKLKTYVHTNLNINIYSGFIHNCQNLKATKMSLPTWLDKQTEVHPYKGTLFNNTILMRNQAIKIHGKILNSYCWMKEVSLKGLHSV